MWVSPNLQNLTIFCSGRKKKQKKLKTWQVGGWTLWIREKIKRQSTPFPGLTKEPFCLKKCLTQNLFKHTGQEDAMMVTERLKLQIPILETQVRFHLQRGTEAWIKKCDWNIHTDREQPALRGRTGLVCKAWSFWSSEKHLVKTI